MIPIGNGIQLVWITMLGHDQSTTSALHSPLTLSGVESFLQAGRRHSQINHFRRWEIQKNSILGWVALYLQMTYVFVERLKQLSGLNLVFLTLHVRIYRGLHETSTVKLWPCRACSGCIQFLFVIPKGCLTLWNKHISGAAWFCVFFFKVCCTSVWMLLFYTFMISYISHYDTYHTLSQCTHTLTPAICHHRNLRSVCLTGHSPSSKG